MRVEWVDEILVIHGEDMTLGNLIKAHIDETCKGEGITCVFKKPDNEENVQLQLVMPEPSFYQSPEQLRKRRTAIFKAAVARLLKLHWTIDSELQKAITVAP